MSQDEIIKHAQNLIAIPSTADNLPALHDAVAYIAKLVDAPGITVEWFESNGKSSFLAYKGTERPKKFEVILNAHVDVVPGQAAQFVPRLENGRLYGRGVHDMKTAAIVMADTFRRLVLQVPYSLALQVVADEEVGGYDGTYHQVQHGGVRADFVLTGEHNFQDDALYNASRGLCWVEIAFKGKTAHGAYVWEGDNAVVKASNFAQKVLQRYPRPEAQMWGTTANIASIHTSNVAYNRVPDDAVLKIDFRFTAEDPVFTSRDTVIDFVRSIDAGAQVLHFGSMEQAVQVSEHNPYLQHLAQSLTATIGRSPVLLSRSGGSDGRHFATVGSGDVVEFGITGNGPHSDEEYIEIESIASYQKTITHFLTTLQATPRA